MAANDNLVFYQRLLGAAGLAIVAYPVYRIIEPFLGPIAWALFLGFLLQPAQERLARVMRGRASISAFSLTLLVLVLFLGPLTALAIAFARQAADLAGRLQGWLAGQRNATLANLDQLPVIGRAMVEMKKAAFVVESEEDDLGVCFGTTYVLIANEMETLERASLTENGRTPHLNGKVAAWTDDYSNMFRILK